MSMYTEGEIEFDEVAEVLFLGDSGGIVGHIKSERVRELYEQLKNYYDDEVTDGTDTTVDMLY